ncbi:MAG: sugar kinase [Actinomycetota bacterium]|nr:sugar kinase [Actinomycetota bacterium]
MTTFRVVVIGDLLYDMFAKIEGPVAFGTDTFTPIHAAPGGSGANAAAWLGTVGAETHFVGRVGDDVFGRSLAGELEGAGVHPHLVYDPSLGTGKVFVLVDGSGERTMITDRGAGEALSPGDLPKSLFYEGHLHLSGYTFSGGSRTETAREALRLAREAGMSTSVDPSSVPLLEVVGPERFLEWTRGVNLCFPNLEEGALLAGERDPARVAEVLLAYYPAVVLKLGSGGALYAEADGTREHVRAAPARVVDTTGAGDALCAGFLSTWLSDGSPSEALRRGVELAARAVERVGARPKGRP